jgi:hypothetical protein
VASHGVEVLCANQAMQSLYTVSLCPVAQKWQAILIPG